MQGLGPDLRLPVFARETETGRLFLLSSLADVRAHAEEFRDLQGDFEYWDAHGRVLVMTDAFIAGADAAPEAVRESATTLLAAFEAFANGPEVDPSTVQEIARVLAANGHQAGA